MYFIDLCFVFLWITHDLPLAAAFEGVVGWGKN